MRLEAGGDGILGDVSPKLAKRRFVADEMVKTFVLPKPTAPVQRLIDLQSRPFLPGFDLLEHGLSGETTHEQMHVIGHDDVVA